MQRRVLSILGPRDCCYISLSQEACENFQKHTVFDVRDNTIKPDQSNWKQRCKKVSWSYRWGISDMLHYLAPLKYKAIQQRQVSRDVAELFDQASRNMDFSLTCIN